MLQPLVLAVAMSAVLFIGYLLLRAYKPKWFGGGSGEEALYIKQETAAEEFVAAQPATRPPEPTKLNTPAPPIPAPASPTKEDLPMDPREVAPGGPHPPNARAARDREATISPEAAPLDPYEGQNMEAPIHDSMRHPELSFGPGVDNSGRGIVAAAGTGSAVALTSETPFSPDFAQNGAGFMGSVFANDLRKGDHFAQV